MICIMPDLWSEVDENYRKAAEQYEARKNEILKKLQKNTKEQADEFMSLLQINYRTMMEQKYTSEFNNREVKLETIVEKHIYNAAIEKAREILMQENVNIEQAIEALKQKSREKKLSIDQEKKFITKELEKIVKRYAQATEINRLVSDLLPSYVSTENQALSASQVYPYVKSIIKKEIYKRAAVNEITKTVKKHPSIILGYVREDAVTQAAIEAIKKISARGMTAKTVGKEASKIDIVIPLTPRASKAIGDSDILSDIIKGLDVIGQNFIVSGTSQYKSDEFLGIQSKPWELSKKTNNWNRNSVGSRAELLKEFNLQNTGLSDNSIGWHRGVLFLSQRLEQIIGPSTDMYAVKGTIIWTSDLLTDLVSVYHKYFSFMLDSKGKRTSHIQLADHYG